MRTRRARVRLAFLAAAILAATLAGPSVLPSSAIPAPSGEAYWSDDLLFTNNASFGLDQLQGYTQHGASDFNDNNRPTCAVTTGHQPSGYAASGSTIANALIGSLSQQHRGPESYRVQNEKGGSGQYFSGQYSYWLHAENDDLLGDSRKVCRQAQVTTDANGEFTVTFPRTLQSAPVAVIWGVSRGISGTKSTPASQLVVNATTTGFTGRAGEYWGPSDLWTPAGNSFMIDYLVVTEADQNEDTIELLPYHHVAGTTVVTTDGSGNATVDWPDLSTLGSAQVMGAYTGTPDHHNPGAVMLDTATPTHGLVHVRNIANQVMANKTITLHYIAFEGRGGGKRVTWGSLAYEQWGYTTLGTLDPAGCDPATSACLRQPAPERSNASAINREYRLTPEFQALGPIDGTDPDTLFLNAETLWDSKDLDVPNLIRDTTPELSEPLFVDASDDPGFPIPCATVVPLSVGSITDGDGINDMSIVWFNHNTNSSIVFGKSPLSVGENCPIEYTYQHELGHWNGFGHADDPDALMFDVARDIPDGLAAEDVENMRGVYGSSVSGTIYPVGGVKLSDLVNLPSGTSAGIITVQSKGQSRLSKNGVVPQTQITVTSDNLLGQVPSTLWVRGGTAKHAVLGDVTLPIPGVKVGARLFVQVKDGEVVQILPVSGGNVVVGEDLAHAGVDDVDGGNEEVVSIAALRSKAKRRAA